MLYFIATPIGNLKEITYRAVEVLKTVDCIYAENPRHSLTLLNAYGIEKPVYSYEKFSERERLDEILTKLKEGLEIAVISDAGMPLICDPGAILTDALVREGLPFTVVSGACAAINAVVLSGMDASAFLTAGFLPPKKADRRRFIDRFKNLSATLVFYSAVHDVTEDLEFLYQSLGARKAAVVREMTKKFEEVIRFRLGEKPEFLHKGEFVIVTEGAPDAEKKEITSIRDKLVELIAQGADKKEAVKIIAEEYGIPKSEVYKESCMLPSEKKAP